MNFVRAITIVFFLLVASDQYAQQVLNTPGTNSQLFLGTSDNQPLIVGLGGSEGGNAWASNYWKTTRDEFINKGFAFLAIGYFHATGAPDTLDRIDIDHIHKAITEATKNKQVDKSKIAIIGGSRGGDLALLLGSYYTDITCVVALLPSHVAFPGHTSHFSTSCWAYKGNELPFVPISEEAIPALMKGDLRATFVAMLKDTLAEQKALIPIEKINGPVLLISASEDEIAPTTMMADKMVNRLKSQKFKHAFEHVVIEGGHTEPLKHFDLVFSFLEKNFYKKQPGFTH